MSALVWVLGLAAAGGLALASGAGESGGDGVDEVNYKGFRIRLAPTKVGTWAFSVPRPDGDDAIGFGVADSRAVALQLAKDWLDSTFPGGPDTVPVGYAMDVEDDDEEVELPEPPIPPPPTSTSPLPPNYQVMMDAPSLQASRLLQAVEGDRSSPSTVFVGADDAWGEGRVATFEALQRLATDHPDVDVRVFSFSTTRRLVGLPPSEPFMSYVAVAVDSTGQPGPTLTGTKRSDPALAEETLANLFALAKGTVSSSSGDELPPGAVLHTVRRPGDPPSRMHVVLVMPDDGEWAWQAWRGRRHGPPIGEGRAPTPKKALMRAKHFVQWYVPTTTPTGLSLG